MSTYCMYDRDSQCFSDCSWCPRGIPERDPDEERDYYAEDEYDQQLTTEDI